MKKNHTDKRRIREGRPRLQKDQEDSEVEQFSNHQREMSDDLEENSRFTNLRKSKEQFLRELNNPNSKHLSTEEKLNSLIEKAEKLASFLLTKHKFFE